MRTRPTRLTKLLALAGVGAAAAGGLAQAPAGPAARASLPEAAALDRLNLRAEWTAYLPIESQRDAVGPVQVVDDNQIFAQTRAGLLVALDARTGARQWGFRYAAGYVGQYPVAVTRDFVFAVNVSRLYCFHRYSGVLQFDYELPGSVTNGPAADQELVYITLNGSKLIAYRYPNILVAAGQRDLSKPGAPGAANNKPLNAAEAVAARYAAPAAYAPANDVEFDQSSVPSGPTTDLGTAAGQRTPSMSALPSVTPPYTVSNRGTFATPSISVLPTLRQPYTFRPDFLRYNQQTPSISVLPPSVARAYELSNYAPKGVEPQAVWISGTGRRYAPEPLLTDPLGITDKAGADRVSRVWLTSEGSAIDALDKFTGKEQTVARLDGRVATGLAGPLAVTPTRVLGVVGLVDGTVVALDLLRGNERGALIEWRVNVGGLMNHKPVVARDAVFASGEQSGVARIDTELGEVVWRTESNADRVLSVNDEHVYVLDRRGALLVYDRRTPSDPATRRSTPLARLALTGFTVPVTNDQTDRVLVASPGGAIACLRDVSPKYLTPVKLVPPLPPPVVPPKDPAAPESPKQ